MKDLSFFLLKGYLGSKKMRKGFKHFCNGPGSTSTLNQKKQGMVAAGNQGPPSMASVYSPFELDLGERQPTLEEMILQLEMEEAASRRAKFVDDEENYGGEIRHRMSCVNSSDILRSARSALNQYPRFSLDGKDAMYRSSFRNNISPVGVGGGRSSSRGKGSDYGVHKLIGMPAIVAGERVVWCSPGVVAKLMGLEAMPIPVQKFGSNRRRDHHLMELNLGRNSGGRSSLHDGDQIEKGRLGFDRNGIGMKTGGGGVGAAAGGASGSCSSSRLQGYSYMKSLRVDDHGIGLRNEHLGWRARRFRQDDLSQY